MRLVGFFATLILALFSGVNSFSQCTITARPTNPGANCYYAVEQVVWTDQVNTGVTGQTLSKTAGGNNSWNAGAASTSFVYDEGFARTVLRETNTDRMFGLSSSNTDEDFTTIGFALYARSNSDLRVYEGGTDRGSVGSYIANDTLRIELDEGVVKYFKNSQLLYVSNVTPTLPLLVDVSINDTGGTIDEAEIGNGADESFTADLLSPGTGPSYQWYLNGAAVATGAIYTPGALAEDDEIYVDATPGTGGCGVGTFTSNLITIELREIDTFGKFYVLGDEETSACKVATEQVFFYNGLNVEISGNTVEKIQGGNNTWNATANSENLIYDNGYLEFIPDESNRDKFIGLSDVIGDAGDSTISYALNLQSDGDIRVYEDDNDRGDWGSYVAGDVFRISVEDGVVRYYQNGNLLYISNVAPTLPLLVDMSLNDVGARARDFTVSNGNTGSFSVAASNEGVSPSYQWQLNGADLPGENGSTYTNTALSNGDIITCVITPDQAGCALAPYTSTPVVVTDIAEANFGNLYVEVDKTATACKQASEDARFSSILNIEATGNILEKIQGGNNSWNGGAASTNVVTNNGFVEFSPGEINRDKIIGLSSVNIDAGDSTIEFGINLQNDADIRIIESDADRGDFGDYVVTDVFKIAVEDGVVHYYKNDVLLYISAITPAANLFVDVSFNDVGARVEDVVIVNGTTGLFTATTTNAGVNPTYQWQVNGIDQGGETNQTFTNTTLAAGDIVTCIVTPDLGGCSNNPYTTPPITISDIAEPNFGVFYIENTADPNACIEAIEEVVFENIENVFVTGNNVVKGQGGNNSWNAGANSLNSVDANNGYLRFVAGEDQYGKVIGLSNDVLGSSFEDIDFAFNLQDDDDIRIRENNANIGGFGTYAANDVFEIRIEMGYVRYYQNGTLLYQSQTAPTFPLFVDISLNDIGAALNDIVVSNGNTGSFAAITTNAGANPSYQWQVNGVDIGGATAATYTNTTLTDGDLVSVKIVPDLVACQSTEYTSNSIEINGITTPDFGVFYIENSADPNACKEAIEEVVFENIENVFVTGNNVVKGQGGNNAWNAGANSLNSVDANNGYLRFVAGDDQYDKMVGLSNDVTGSDFTTIDYAIFLQDDDDIRIWENNVSIGGFGTYSTNDVFEIRVEQGYVRYYHNGVLLYQSLSSPTFPLFVDLSLNDVGATVNDITVSNGNTGSFAVVTTNAGASPSYQWQLNGVDIGGETGDTYTNTSLDDGDIVTVKITPDIDACQSTVYTSNSIQINDITTADFGTFYVENTAASSACKVAIEEPVFENIQNIFVNGNSLTKGQGGNNSWNAGASSLNSVKDNGYLEFTAGDQSDDKIVGLSSVSIDAGDSTIEYGIFLQDDGDIRIRESDVDRGDVGNYVINDVFRISVEDGVVHYYQNGNLIYLSNVAPTLPLVVDVSFNDIGATINDVVVVNGNTGVFNAIVTDAGPSPTYQWQLNGLDLVGENASTYTNTTLDNGDIVTCVITPDLGGCSNVSYTSNPVTVNDIVTPSFGTFFVENTAATNACKEAIEQVVFTDNVNIYIDGNDLTKGQGGNNSWNAGTNSLNSVKDNGYMEFTAGEQNRDKMVGITADVSGVGFANIDFALNLQNDGDIRIYENGNDRGDVGDYTTGDVFRISVEDGVVHYYQNGNLLYLSNDAPTLPLLVDVSFNDVGATVNDVIVSNGNTGVFNAFTTNAGASPSYQWQLNGLDLPGEIASTYTNILLDDGDVITCIITPDLGGCSNVSYTSNPVTVNDLANTEFGTFFVENTAASEACNFAVEDVTFENNVNVYVTGNDVVKGQGGNNTWNAGVNSVNSVKNNGYAEFSPGEQNRDKMVGITSDVSGVGFSNIDYTFNLQNDGDIRIYENGSDRGDFGDYVTGDIFRISVENNTVHYYQNGTLLYVSLVTPSLPLFVDISLNDNGATVNDVVVVNGNTGVFASFATNAGASPSYQWQLNGIDEGGETGATYTNAALTDSDVVTLKISPDIDGCGNVEYTSQQVAVLGSTDPSFETYFIANVPIATGTPVAYEEITWDDAVNIFIDDNTVTKGQGGNNNWNAGAFSENVVVNNAFAQTVITQTNRDRAFGLSDTDGGVDFNSIDYKFFLRNNGDLRVYEGASNRGTFGSYAVGDTLKVAVVSNTVEFYRNGTLLYTSSITPTLPLHVDVSINDVNGVLNDVQIVSLTDGNFSANLTNAGADPDYQWKLNGANVGTNNPSYTNNALVDDDIITLEVTPDLGGCAGTAYISNEILIDLFNPILPVELLSFTARNTEVGVELEWTTATELNNDRFILEKSTNGESYELVTDVKGAGTTNRPNNYRFHDLQPNSVVTYYRLKQRDFDGTTVILDIERVEPSPYHSIQLKRNPVFSGAIELQGKLDMIAEARLISTDGRMVRTYSSSFESLPIGDAKSGVYVLEVITEEGGKLSYRVAIRQ